MADPAKSPESGPRPNVCRESLRLPGERHPVAICKLEAGHEGLHIASHDFERIVPQHMFDGGLAHHRVWYSVAWHTQVHSTVETGQDSPEWRESLRV